MIYLWDDVPSHFRAACQRINSLMDLVLMLPLLPLADTTCIIDDLDDQRNCNEKKENLTMSL